MMSFKSRQISRIYWTQRKRVSLLLILKSPMVDGRKKGVNVEIRKIWCNTKDAEYVRERLNVPGCEMIACVTREIVNPDGTLESSDTRYCITSLSAERIAPGQLLQTIRNHWQVENNLHWMKDRYWDEDRHYLKWSGKVFIGLTNLALSVLNLMRGENDSIKETAEDVRYKPEKILQTLGWKN